MGIGIDGDALLQRQALDHLCSIDRNVAHKQGKGGGNHSGIGCGLGGMYLEFNAVLCGDEGGVSRDFVAVDVGGNRVIDGT